MATTQQLSMNLGITQVPETQDQKLFPELLRIYNALNIVASALDSYTGALPPPPSTWSALTPVDTIQTQRTQRLYLQFSESVGAGELVTIWNDAGTPKAKKAGGNPWAGDTRGFATASVTAGAFGEIVLGGLDIYISGLTPGVTYYTSNSVAGAMTAT